MSEKITEYLFRPVRCLESALENITPLEGSLYFTLDTQKIFLAKGNKLIQMCESRGFYYGIKEIEYDNSGNKPDPQVDFYLDEIENDKLPEIDDLILNKDGCFYRVKEILDEETVRTERLTLQGTGTGGSDDGDVTANFRISAPSGTVKYFSLEAKEAYIDLIAYSSDTTNFISSIECSFDKTFNSIFYSQFNLSYALEKTYSINLIKYLGQMSAAGTKVYVRVSDKYGSSRSLGYTVYVPSLQLTSNQELLFGISEDKFDYTCSVGGTKGLEGRIITYKIKDINNIETTLGSYELSATETNVTKSLDLSKVVHGEYTLSVQLHAQVGGTTIRSNELIHKMLRYDTEVNQPIFSVLIPEKTEQYTDIPISYLLYFGNNTKTYSVDFILNDKIETTQMLTAGTISSYNLNFDNIGTYEFILSIDELGIDYRTSLTITKYTGVLPVINIDNDALKVYLTAKGRTNNAADKEFWPDYKTSTMKASLSNFYYRTVNGWMIDENGVPFLKVSQGASVVFDGYSPYTGNPKSKGITIELDFKLSGILDYSDDARLIECVSLDNNKNIKTGFYITGDKFKYYASSNANPLVSLDLVSDQRIRLTFVIEPENTSANPNPFPMCYTYLNGILSNAYNYQNSDDFSNSVYDGFLKINSAYGQIDVYNIRFYSIGLNAEAVLYNYQAGLSPLERRQESYEDNLIRDINGNIDLELVESDNYKLKIPYVKITGGFPADNNKTMRMSDKKDDSEPALPVGKKDYRLINIEIHYPSESENVYFKNYPEVFKVQTIFDDKTLNVLNGFGETPTEAAVMYAQGTSSLEYPVKNLRVKFKGHEIRVRPDLEPVNLICFKADYMESSGSHNTGASNYIDDAYKAIEIATPGQTHYNQEKIVTCIKGHPCVIFWSPSGEKGTYQYIGKYNLNLDKATPEPFGFKNDETNFGYEKDENGELILNEKGEKINSIYCFEFLDNNEKVCNFLSDEIANSNEELKTEQEKYYDTWYSDRKNKDNEIVPGWAIGFESRYPEDKKEKNDADKLWPLASWLNSLYALYEKELQEGKKPSGTRPVYKYTEASSFNKDKVYYIKIEENEYQLAYPTEENFSENTYYTRETEKIVYSMESLRRFKDEYQEYLDQEFLLAYYIITEALLMADSRVKNMMIATWGKEHRSFKLSDGTEKSIYNYIWYPIFYDMDTMLGLDNAGHVNKNYYDEDTNEGVFNGAEVLWKFVRDTLPNELAQFYSRLEQASGFLTKNGILPYFNKNQASMANETFYNEDAIYKYITPFRTGYQDHLNEKYIEPGTGERLYAAQGSRDMMREFFIENRIRYLRGKYSSTGYQSGDRIEFRLTYPKEISNPKNEEEERINASIKAVPPSGKFELSSMKTGYAGIKVGANVAPTNKRFENEQTQEIEVNTTAANGTESYILGASNLASVGDLSDKYPYNLIVGTASNNLRSLILGNHHKDYYNPYWSGVKNINLANFTYLEEFNLENCGSFTGSLGFTDCSQVKIIRATGSQAKSIDLPLNGVLEELRIPSTINNLTIDSHETLTKDNFTIGYYDYNLNTYVNDYSKLTHINIINTPIDSYSMVKGALKLNEEQTEGNLSLLEYFKLLGINWNITDLQDVIIENNEIKGIKILNALRDSKLKPIGVPKQEALSGYIKVDVGNYTVNEFKLYEEYQNDFPNVVIEYVSTGLQKAFKIHFYNSETILGEPYYTVLSDGTKSLASLTGNDSPAGSILSTPIKPSDNKFDYKFNGLWTIAKTEDGNLMGQPPISVEDFDTIIPVGETSFTANYNSSDRKYKILLYDDDGTTILVSENLKWDDDIGEILGEEKGYTQLTYNYKIYENSNSNPHNRWTFDGWQSTNDFNDNSSNVTWNTLKGIKVSRDFIAYAHYKEEDARQIPTSIEYFDFIENDFVESIYGIGIKIKEKYRKVLSGKITLPSKYNEAYISLIGDFNDIFNVEDIYFLTDNQYRGITHNGFMMNQDSKLTNVYLPKTEHFVYLGNYSFANCTNLKKIDIEETNLLNDFITNIGDYCFGIASALNANITKKQMQVNVQNLPSYLKHLGAGAFYGGLGVGNPNIHIEELPNNLLKLSTYCLRNCPKVNIREFGSNQEGYGLQIINSGALIGAGKDINEIVINKSITNLTTTGETNSYGMGAFSDYGPGASAVINKVIYYKKPEEIFNTDSPSIPIGSFADTGLKYSESEYIEL